MSDVKPVNAEEGPGRIKMIKVVDPQVTESRAVKSEFNKSNNEFFERLRNYHEKGFVIYKGVVGADLLKRLNAEIDRLESTLKIGPDVFDEDKTGKIKQIQYLHHKGEVCNELLKFLMPIADDLLGTNKYTILNMQLFEKHPEISKPTRSHQDNAYFKLTPTTPLTIWVALDDIDEENGCLYYAPGSHKLPTRKHSRYNKDTTFRIRSGVPGLSLCLHEHPEETDEKIEVARGDVLVHNCNTIHRAGKNNSAGRRRRAIGIVCVPTDCVTDPRLQKYHEDQLAEDIELQKVKDPTTYKKFKHNV